MDAAAREMKIDPAELRRRNMIRPEQMPYKNAMGQTYDSGAFEKILDQGLALADWNGFAARREESKAARQAARPRHRHLPRVDQRHCAFEEKVIVDVTPDGFIEIFSATQAMGQGIADQLRAARGRRVRRADREGAHRPGRHRSRQRLRQRRLALALHRRLGGEGRRRADHRRMPRASPPRRSRPPPPTSSTAPAASRSSAPTSASTCSRSPASRPAQRIHVDAIGDRRRADLAERLPRLRGRDRSRQRRRAGRRVRVGQRHRPGRQPDDRARPGRRRRGPGHRPGALRAGRLRRRQQPARHRQLHGLRDAARRGHCRSSAPSSTPRSPA